MMDHKARLGAWLFPILLAVFMGGISFWLNEISSVEVMEAPLNPDEPRYTMTDVSGKVYGKDGLMQDSMTANTVWQLPDNNEVNMTLPVLKVYQSNQEVYRVTASTGRYDTEHKLAFMDNQVVLTKAAIEGQEPGYMKTEHLQVDTVSKIARTDDVVDFQMGLSTGQTKGMVYDHHQKSLNLKSRVRATIYDPKKQP